jgi:5-formyltetrahydrofolate cyclo-ligase
MEKAEARQRAQQAVERLTVVQRRDYSRRICERLLALPEVTAAGAVMAYLPMPDELDTLPFLERLLAEGKSVCVPRTFAVPRRMVPIRLRNLQGLRTGAFGIAEPDHDEACDPAALDLIVVPARAFDMQGHRLGRGAGYYDRFLAFDAPRAVRCGAAFSCQIVDAVPCEAHDMLMQILVTEERVIRPTAA